MRLIQVPLFNYFNECFKNIFNANQLLLSLIYFTMSIILASSFFPSLQFMNNLIKYFLNNNQNKINRKFRKIKSCDCAEATHSTSDKKSSNHKLPSCETSSKSCNSSDTKKYKKSTTCKKSVSCSNSTICSINSKKNKFIRKNKYHSKYNLKNRNGLFNKKNKNYLNSTEVSRVLKNFKLD